MSKFLGDHNRPGEPLTARLFNEIRRQARRNRVTVSGAAGQVQTAAGTLVRLATGFDVALIRTTSAVTGRSGTTPGTGTAVRILWDGTALIDGNAFDLLNVSASAGSTGKYGLAVRLFGVWWLLVLECS